MAAIGPGWVYVLSNKAHTHLLKIGRSEDAPERRAAELNSTGVPYPFMVEFKIYVSECDRLEDAVHKELGRRRINTRREFFKLSIEEAAKCIARQAVEQADASAELFAYVRKERVYKNTCKITL
jgi:hypothetical protein